MQLGVEEIKTWISNLNDQIQENKQYLTELDQAIGDGDHGLNMARGFNEVMLKIKETDFENVGLLFKDIGMTLLTKVGGASGPLYGTAFIKAATTLENEKSITIPKLCEALEISLEGIKARGKANVKDKTMIDVWEPVVMYMKTNKDNINWDYIIKLANEKMDETKHLEALKGRAAYLGKRSIGHIDPGATSSKYLFTELAKVIKGVNL